MVWVLTYDDCPPAIAGVHRWPWSHPKGHSAVSQPASGSQLNLLRMLWCSEKKYICHCSRELAVAPMPLWMLMLDSRNWVLTCPQQEQVVFQKLWALKKCSTAQLRITHKDLWSPEEAGMMPFAVTMIAGFASWKSSVKSLAPLLSLHLAVIYVPVAVRSAGTQKSSRSYIGMQGILQICIK